MTENITDEAPKYVVSLTQIQLAMAIASLEVTLEDVVVEGFAGTPEALLFVGPLENLLAVLEAAKSE